MIIFRSHEDYSGYSMENLVIAPDDSNNWAQNPLLKL